MLGCFRRAAKYDHTVTNESQIVGGVDDVSGHEKEFEPQHLTGFASGPPPCY
jgi:hypothetical protein